MINTQEDLSDPLGESGLNVTVVIWVDSFALTRLLRVPPRDASFRFAPVIKQQRCWHEEGLNISSERVLLFSSQLFVLKFSLCL